VTRLTGRERPQQIEIEPVADEVISGANRGIGFGGAGGRIARADADDEQAAPGAADVFSADDAG